MSLFSTLIYHFCQKWAWIHNMEQCIKALCLEIICQLSDSVVCWSQSAVFLGVLKTTKTAVMNACSHVATLQKKIHLICCKLQCVFMCITSTQNSLKIFSWSPGHLVRWFQLEDKRINHLRFIWAMSGSSGTPLPALHPSPVPCGQEAWRLSPYPLLISPSQQCHLFAGWYKWEWLEQGVWLICACMPRDNQQKIRPGGEGEHSSEVWPALSCQKTLSSVCEWLQICKRFKSTWKALGG